MLLVIDVGNTNIVLGVYKGKKLIASWRMTTSNSQTADEIGIFVHSLFDYSEVDAKELDDIIISSVVPQVTNAAKLALEKILKKNVMVVGAGVKTGLNIRMDNPSSVGSDLIVGAVAGVAQYPVPLIIFDLGTANTVCVIDKNKDYIGGMIYPGIQVSVDSLTANASQLSGISLEAPKQIIGKNTVDCMKSGVIYSSASAMDGIIDRMEEALGEKATVVATGGLAKKIVPHCKREITLDDDLLLKGLAIIYDKNVSTNRK